MESNIIQHIIISVVATVALTVGWGMLQFLARKVGTKNHMDNAGGCGHGCSCMGGACDRKSH